MLLRELQRDRIFEAAVAAVGLASRQPPSGKRVGSVRAPHLGETRQSRHVATVGLGIDRPSRCLSAIAHVVVASGPRDNFDHVPNVVWLPSGAREHAAEYERTVMARAR